ncbi:hypothetical protein L1887_24692 [Cichorium endivia]|nr:hypothetical protein L1887_24692 [Cichorium endivia]
MDPHSFIARAEAQRWLGIAEKLLMGHDLVGAKTFAIRARESDPRLEAADQILAIADTLLAAEKRVVGSNGTQQPDFYAILQLVRFVEDAEHIAAQYRRLAVTLNPHQNRFPYSDQAFQLVNEAWAVLSNHMRKSMYDSELDFPPQQQMNTIGFNLEQQQHHHHQQQQQHHHQHQHNFFSINHMGSGHEQELAEPQQTFQTRVQRSHQQEHLQQHNFLSQPNPVRPSPVREQEQLFQQREQEQLFQPQVQPFQITSTPQQQSRPPPQPPMRSPTPPPPAAPPQPPVSWPQQSQHSKPQPLRRSSTPPPVATPQSPYSWPQAPPHSQQQPPMRSPTPPPPPAAPPQPPVSWPEPPPYSQPQPPIRSPTPPPPPAAPPQPPVSWPEAPPHSQPQPPQTQFQPQQQLQEDLREQQQQQHESPEQNPTPVELPNHVDTNNDLSDEESERATNADSENIDTSPTFWTACPYCLYMYEYPSIYTECTLRCDNCERAFQAVPVPSPPPLTDDQETYFCCWGSFPLGLSISHLEKNKLQGTNTNWTPFSPIYDVSSQIHNHLNNTTPKKPRNWGPRVYKDDATEDIFTDISEPSDDSDADWDVTNNKKVKKTKKRGRKRKAKVVSVKQKTNKSVSVGSSPPTVLLPESSKKGLVNIARRQSGRVAKELGKLDLNVEFNNNEGEEPGAKMGGANRQGEEDNIEGNGFFEGLDEFLSSLPILSVVNEEKVKGG